MKIKRDVFAIAHGVRDEKGNKGEPEEQPTRTLIESTMTAGLSTGGESTSIPLLITHDAPAGEMARELAARCKRCKHFKRKAWQNLVEECDFPTAPLMKRQAINEVRSALLLTRNAQITEPGEIDGEFDVEHVMRQHMGLCAALSDLKKDFVVVHQEGCCPESSADHMGKVWPLKTAQQPVGLFVPRDGEAKKEAASTYDGVLKQAQGKLP